MTRIDFYILDTSTPRMRENFACRLIEKIRNQEHTIFVKSDSAEHAILLDDLLWSYKAESFIPHTLSDSNLANNCSVVIGGDNTTLNNRNNNVLINFDSTVPESFSQYSRVVEIVNKQDNSSIDGRIRYKFYQDRGYKMESHNIRG